MNCSGDEVNPSLPGLVFDHALSAAAVESILEQAASALNYGAIFPPQDEASNGSVVAGLGFKSSALV